MSNRRSARKTTAAKKATKSSKSSAARSRKRNYESFSTFIYRVLKQVHPETGISNKAMAVRRGSWVFLFLLR